MDFKVNREIISSDEIIYDGTQEQSVELDCILPDYYPDIFKVIKCMICPNVVAQTISGDKLNYELVVKINILYCAENSGAVQCVEQKMTFSKSVDFGSKCDEPVISLTPYVDYVNCRAVNQRRLDIRGAVSTKIKALCEKKQEAVCDAFGMNIQLKKENVSVVGSRLNKQRCITVSDDIDIGYSKPAVIGIVRYDAVNMNIDKKIIANKIIIKGEAKVNMLYSCKKDDSDCLEAMEFTMPYSQIIDVDGIDESYECMLDAEIMRCELCPRSNDDGEMKIIECELAICVKCCAMKMTDVRLVADAYSTTYNCECTASDADIEVMPQKLCETHIEKIAVASSDAKIKCVYDAWCKVKSVKASYEQENKTVKITGNIMTCVMACDDEGKPILLESEQAFEHKFVCEEMLDKVKAEPCVNVMSSAYSLNDSGNIEVKCEMRVCAVIRCACNCSILSDIKVDGDSMKKSENYALKMYFADEGETMWDIAKKYSTSIEAIAEENDGESADGRRMLLIPIVS